MVWPAAFPGSLAGKRQRDGPTAGNSSGGQDPLRRLGLQGPPRRPLLHRRLGLRRQDPGGGTVRAVDDAGHRREPRDVPDGHHAPRQCRLRQHRHQLPRHLLHALPPRRLRRRHLPRPLPHHRHLRRRASRGRDDTDDIDGGAGAEAAGVRGRDGGEQRLRAGERHAAGGALPGAVPDGAGDGRAQVERVGVRVGPVRRVRRRREAADDALLQLVLLLHQHRRAARRHSPRLRPGQPRQAVGVRRLRRSHPLRPRRLPRRHYQLPIQEAGRQPAHADRRSHHRRVEQACAPSAIRPGHALRRGRRCRRRRGRQGQAEAAPHQAMPVLGPGGRRGAVGGGVAGGEVEAVHANGRGGGEAGGAHAPDVGDHHPVLDGVRADDHLLGGAGVRHGPPHRRLLPHPRRLPHRLLRRLHPPHRPRLRPPRRAARPPPHCQPPRALPAPAHLRRPPPLHRRHGHRRAHRAQAPPLRRRRRLAVRLLARAAVPPRRRRRGVHVHRSARLLPEGVPQGHEDHEHRAVPEHALAGLLPQHGAGEHRPPADGAEWQGRVARRQPRRRQALQLLLVARRAQLRQPRRVPGRGEGVRLQGEAPGRRRHRARRRRRARPCMTCMHAFFCPARA